MAEGRMIKKKISVSLQVHRLSCTAAKLLFTWMIPHQDVKGRLIGEPISLKGTVCPLEKGDDFAEERIAEYLQEMDRLRLIRLYTVDGQQCIEMTGFPRHQKIREDREAASIIPPPPSETPTKTTPIPETREKRSRTPKTTPQTQPATPPHDTPQQQSNQQKLQTTPGPELDHDRTGITTGEIPEDAGPSHSYSQSNRNYIQEKSKEDFPSNTQPATIGAPALPNEGNLNQSRQPDDAGTGHDPTGKPEPVLQPDPDPLVQPVSDSGLVPVTELTDALREAARSANRMPTVSGANGTGQGSSSASLPDIDPHERLPFTNPWRAFRLNINLAERHADFTAKGLQFLQDLWLDNPNITVLAAGEALLGWCQDRHIEYPPGLLKRVKDMQRVRDGRSA